LDSIADPPLARRQRQEVVGPLSRDSTSAQDDFFTKPFLKSIALQG
jgi:hypothetical protein